MKDLYVLTICIIILIFTINAYLGAKEGFIRAFQDFLKLFIPMFLTGIIVKISHLISKSIIVDYIIGMVGFTIFFIVAYNVIKKGEKSKRYDIINSFLGVLVGMVNAWLICGFIMLYIQFFGSNFFKYSFKDVIGDSLYYAMTRIVDLILFLKMFNF